MSEFDCETVICQIFKKGIKYGKGSRLLTLKYKMWKTFCDRLSSVDNDYLHYYLVRSDCCSNLSLIVKIIAIYSIPVPQNNKIIMLVMISDHLWKSAFSYCVWGNCVVPTWVRVSFRDDTRILVIWFSLLYIIYRNIYLEY